jgi:hypothetical protein
MAIEVKAYGNGAPTVNRQRVAHSSTTAGSVASQVRPRSDARSQSRPEGKSMAVDSV